MTTPLDLDEAAKALAAARGCDCCAVMGDLAALVPCSPACAVFEDDDDEEVEIVHTYEAGCAHAFRSAARALLDRVAEEAVREYAADLAGRLMGREATLNRLRDTSITTTTRTRLKGKVEGVALARSFVEEALR